MNQPKELKLMVPRYYLEMAPELRRSIANGCGPSKPRWLARLIPDTIFGVSCKHACNIHDVAYYAGMNRFMADYMLYVNLTLTAHYTMRLVNSKWEAAFRWSVLVGPNMLYFIGVRIFGRLFFTRRQRVEIPEDNFVMHNVFQLD